MQLTALFRCLPGTALWLSESVHNRVELGAVQRAQPTEEGEPAAVKCSDVDSAQLKLLLSHVLTCTVCVDCRANPSVVGSHTASPSSALVKCNSTDLDATWTGR